MNRRTEKTGVPFPRTSTTTLLDGFPDTARTVLRSLPTLRNNKKV